MKLKSGDLIHVTTHDIEHGNEGWKSLKDVAREKPQTYEVVGWIVKERRMTTGTTTPITSTRCRIIFGPLLRPSSPVIRFALWPYVASDSPVRPVASKDRRHGD
ncbi:MAG: hypothetical protein H0W36_00595 [Gemmatimonadetes bacterium]|nr:hypothetical protein [Gemmatimonadota bacterium]